MSFNPFRSDDNEDTRGYYNPEKKVKQEKKNGEYRSQAVNPNTQGQVPQKTEYRFAGLKPSPIKSDNSQTMTVASESEETKQKKLRFPTSCKNEALNLSDDSEDDRDEDENPFALKNGSVSKDLPQKNAEYYNKWVDMVELERHQDTIDKKNEIRLPVIFHEVEDKLLIFYQTFKDSKKAYDFKNKVSRLKRIIITPANARQQNYRKAEDEFESHGLEGQIREIKMSYENGQQICILYIASQNVAVGQLKSNSQWEISEDKPNFYDQMIKNLSKLCMESPDKFDLIGSLHPPTFEDDGSLQKYKHLYEGKLNHDQQQALEKCLKTNDYSLIHGLPGTGKTFVIVILLRILVEKGEKILVSSHTHFAIDNILERFVRDYPHLRSKVVRVSSDIKKVSENLKDLIYPRNTPGGLEEDDRLETQQIIAVTCQAAVNQKLNAIEFDTCIIDEASQAPEPVVLGPLLLAKRFILFGDHFQLQPLIRSEEAKEKGMNLSLFERLAQKNSNAVSTLTTQYRMNQEIMNFSNSLVYGKKMTCGTDQVKTGRLNLKSMNGNTWTSEVLNPKKPVVFLDLIRTRQMPQKKFGSQNYSQDQATKSACNLTTHLVADLISSGLDAKDIGVITPLNSDVDQIKQDLKERKIPVEVFTVDSCQGIDKKCIIINFSMEKNRTRGLLGDWKRVNVAFTRAKNKLIMIGSMSDLKEVENIKEYMHLVKNTSEVFTVTDEHLAALKI